MQPHSHAHPLAPSLAGFRGIRGDVLVALKKAQPVTAKELAAEFRLTPNALRRHLKELEAEGFVRCAREVRGVGGPVLAYSLTEAGEGLFPRAYDVTLATVLDGVRERNGPEAVVQLFRAQWEHAATGAAEQLVGLPLSERAQLLAELLTSHGYMAEAAASAEPDEALIREHNCVLRAVAERFPEVCVAEEKFLAEFLGAVVERRKHIASGASCCEYCVRESGIEGRESGIGNRESLGPRDASRGGSDPGRSESLIPSPILDSRFPIPDSRKSQ